MPTITINNTQFNLSTKLRVAYVLQEKNGHKPYMSIFEGLAEMPLEKQIQFIWIAFNLENPAVESTRGQGLMNEKEFTDIMLDEYGIQVIMDLVTDIMDGIMYNGMPPEEVERKKLQRQKESEKE